MDAEAQVEANNAKAYAQAAWTLFNENRSDRFPYVKRLDIESGPLLFLCGHALEISCKSILRARGFDKDKLKNFRGFRYNEGRRRKRSAPRRHNVSFLFRAVHLLALNHDDRSALNQFLISHTYWHEKYEAFLDAPPRLDILQLKLHIELLDRGFDSPYSYRYAESGFHQLPSSELLLVAAEFLCDFERNKFLRLSTQQPTGF